MVSKENILLLGLFAMVVLMSSAVRARDLAKASSISAIARIVKEQKDASDVEYEKNACTEDHDHPDCFFPWFPGMPGGGGKPEMPGGGDKPGGGYMPGMPGGGDMPGGGYIPGTPGGGDMPKMPGGGDKPGMPGGGPPGVNGYHGGQS